jgi:hypothetical protein
MMLKPTRTIRLTLLLRPDQFDGLRHAAEKSFSRPSDFARRCLLQAIADAARAAERKAPQASSK